jgi:hypothetical protein
VTTPLQLPEKITRDVRVHLTDDIENMSNRQQVQIVRREFLTNRTLFLGMSSLLLLLLADIVMSLLGRIDIVDRNKKDVLIIIFGLTGSIVGYSIGIVGNLRLKVYVIWAFPVASGLLFDAYTAAKQTYQLHAPQPIDVILSKYFSISVATFVLYAFTFLIGIIRARMRGGA